MSKRQNRGKDKRYKSRLNKKKDRHRIGYLLKKLRQPIVEPTYLDLEKPFET